MVRTVFEMQIVLVLQGYEYIFTHTSMLQCSFSLYHVYPSPLLKTLPLLISLSASASKISPPSRMRLMMQHDGLLVNADTI